MLPPPRYILAPYVATPPDIVERLLDSAEVGPGDRVYDLGCGDGRVAIAAARRGAQAYGVDIEPWWIEQAQAAALSAGVADRTRFERVDALDLDLAAADVIVLYLVQWSTERVAAQIRAQCRPGTRIVSHSFGFGAGVDSEAQCFVDADGAPRRIHRWVLGEGAG